MNMYLIYIIIMYLSFNWWFSLLLLCPICTTVIKYPVTSCPFCSDTLVSHLINYYFRFCQWSLYLSPEMLLLTLAATPCVPSESCCCGLLYSIPVCVCFSLPLTFMPHCFILCCVHPWRINPACLLYNSPFLGLSTFSDLTFR